MSRPMRCWVVVAPLRARGRGRVLGVPARSGERASLLCLSAWKRVVTLLVLNREGGSRRPGVLAWLGVVVAGGVFTCLVCTIPVLVVGGWCLGVWLGVGGLVASGAHLRGVNDAIGWGRGVLLAVVGFGLWVCVVVVGGGVGGCVGVFLVVVGLVGVVVGCVVGCLWWGLG